MSDLGMGEDQDKIDALEQYLEENLSGVDTVQCFNREKENHENWPNKDQTPAQQILKIEERMSNKKCTASRRESRV